jgi:DNA (cytosine-5)-methyltransferase 1
MIAATLDQRGRGPTDAVMIDGDTETFVVNCFNGYTGGPDDNDAQANHLIAFSSKDHGADAGEISPTLRSQNFKDSHMNGGGQVAIAFAENQRGEVGTGDISPQLSCSGGKPGSGYSAVAFTERTRTDGRNFESQEELAYAITNPGSGGRTNTRQVAGHFGVRRLTPTECERLQGFPDGWTGTDHEGKAISDSARYRMLGNAVAVPVAQWIGERIVLVCEGLR